MRRVQGLENKQILQACDADSWVLFDLPSHREHLVFAGAHDAIAYDVLHEGGTAAASSPSSSIECRHTIIPSCFFSMRALFFVVCSGGIIRGAHTQTTLRRRIIPGIDNENIIGVYNER